MTAEEEAWLRAARGGDRDAFDRLCRRHRDDLVGLCLRFTGSRDDAEDVVQVAFSQAWTHLDRFRGEAGLRTWLWEIARNRCLNHLRARKSQLQGGAVSLDDADHPAAEVADERPTPEESAVASAGRTALRDAVKLAALERGWQSQDWALFAARIDSEVAYADFAAEHGRDEAYWRNRWRDKIKP
ncbi:MAG: RNA polymerase sigma factor, partial [Armatimonadota bacterium]